VSIGIVGAGALGSNLARAFAKAGDLMQKTGFFPVDLGALDVGGPRVSLPFGPLAGASFVKI